ncbi:MAG TPA: hypothetical protein VFO52_06395 [Longimicrobiales bacterium]|nr:hypothetical protein [Longimicrobiales bacterium]
MRRSRICSAIPSAMLVVLAACSDPTSSEPTALVIEPGANARTLQIGSQQQLTAFYVDAQGRHVSDASVEWSSSDPSIAHIDPSGLLRLASSYTACDFVTPGLCQVEIIARAGEFEARQQLTILPYSPVMEVNVAQLYVEIGYPQQIFTSVLLELQPVPWCAVSYSVRDPAIAQVDPVTGIINGIDIGNTVIDVNVHGPICPGGDQVEISSIEPLHVISILPETQPYLTAGESVQLTAFVTNWKEVVYPALYVQWTSSNPQIATVENGLVRAAPCEGDDDVCRVTITARSGRLVTSRSFVVR